MRALAYALAGIIFFAGVLWSEESRAEYHACNETSYMLEVAVATLSDLGPISQGWVVIAPGNCDRILRAKLHRGLELFAYARSTDVYGVEGISFAGETPFCIREEEFLIEGVGLCRLRHYQHARFARIAFSAESWVTYFSEDRNYGLKKAAIAGAQRLLGRLGYSVGGVDGVAGSRTRLALDAFRKEHHVPNDTAEIFEALSDEAASLRGEVGLEVCNRSVYRIWAAVGIEDDAEQVETRGWLPADPEKCVSILEEPLDSSAYYLFAEAVDENGFPIESAETDVVWGGEHILCVSAIRFTIDEQGECDARNFDQRGFYRLQVGAQKRLTITLK